MKRSKRKSWLITAGVLIVAALLWISYAGGIVPSVWEVNALLKNDPELAEYPYKFRAVLLASGVATVTRPYDREVPPFKFLQVIEPELAGKSLDDPAFVAALRRLKAAEQRAQQVTAAHPEADGGVEWVLDRAWYHKQGIALPPLVQ
jgi:hypothetical protein